MSYHLFIGGHVDGELLEVTQGVKTVTFPAYLKDQPGIGRICYRRVHLGPDMTVYALEGMSEEEAKERALHHPMWKQEKEQ